MWSTSQAEIAAAESLAEFTYRNQMLERHRTKPVSTLLARFGANWPCMWGEEVTGTMQTWAQNWAKYKDGWKFTCGLHKITAPCVVYSMGSRGNMAFEAAVLAARPDCSIHIFDKGRFGLSSWFPEQARGASPERRRVTYHRMYIAPTDDLAAKPPHRSLRSIMRELGHTHIDILKADIEGSEFAVFADPHALPSVGQLLIEVHTRGREPTQYGRLLQTFEARGLRLFHKEINARFDTECIELALIQKNWRPELKNYSAVFAEDPLSPKAWRGEYRLSTGASAPTAQRRLSSMPAAPLGTWLPKLIAASVSAIAATFHAVRLRSNKTTPILSAWLCLFFTGGAASATIGAILEAAFNDLQSGPAWNAMLVAVHVAALGAWSSVAIYSHIGRLGSGLDASRHLLWQYFIRRLALSHLPRARGRSL